MYDQTSFRREEGNCRVCWYAASITDIDLGGKVTKGVINVGLNVKVFNIIFIHQYILLLL